MKVQLFRDDSGVKFHIAEFEYKVQPTFFDKESKGFTKHKFKIYLSGKITGLNIDEASAKFNEYEELLCTRFTVINPMKLRPAFGLHYWPFYMIRDLWELIHCKAIFLIPDWETSKGAKIEKKVAECFLIDVVYITEK